MRESEDRLAELEAKVTELAEQNARLQRLVGGAPSAPSATTESPTPTEGTVAVDRRAAIRRLGGAAAAAVGLVAANGAVRPTAAAAADGDNVVVGGSYSGTETAFSFAGGSGSETNAALQAINSTGAAFYGSTTSGVGFRGFASGVDGVAVKGRATAGGATSILGEVVNGDDGGVGVLGEATGSSSAQRGYGVRGNSNSIFGNGAGVLGSNGAGGVGVFGLSAEEGGIGVYAEGGDSLSVPGTGVLAVSHFGSPLRLSSAAISVPPTIGSWSAGSFLVRNGALWYCIASGTGSASEWVRLSGAFVPLESPTRVYDSRDGDGKLDKGETRDIDIAAATAAIPASASAVLLNATVANTVSSGFLTLYPQGSPVPTTSSVNYTAAGQIVGNNATVGLTGGQITARVDGGSSSNSIDVILDAYGYYA